MSTWSAEIRRREASERRAERENQKRYRELEKRIKERAKLSELEQARLEVEQFENELEILLSVQKERSVPVDWQKIAAALPPPVPVRLGRHEFMAILAEGEHGVDLREHDNAEEARFFDEQEYQALLGDYRKELAEFERLRSLATRVLAGELAAYTEAISEFSALGELSQLGSSIHFTVGGRKLIECVLTINGTEIIPAQVKSLTATKKLSEKAMPKARFQEIYQDYICGCVLRLGREVLALLPVDTVLVTASIYGTDTRRGKKAELPVLSIELARHVMEELDFERLDPSDSMENFLHRGDVKAARKDGEFLPIVPLTPADLTPIHSERVDFSELLARVRELRQELSAKLTPLTTAPFESATDAAEE